MSENYESDIKIRVRFTVGGVTVNIPSHDFCLRFRTQPGGTYYDCSKKSGVYNNCAPDQTNPQYLICSIDGAGFTTGHLYVELFDFVPDDSFDDGNMLKVVPCPMGTDIVVGAGDGAEIDADVAVEMLSQLGDFQDEIDEKDAAIWDELTKLVDEEITPEIKRIKYEESEIDGTTFKANNGAVLSRGSNTYVGTSRGDIVGVNGHHVRIYEVEPGETLLVNFGNNSGTALSMAWFKSGVNFNDEPKFAYNSSHELTGRKYIDVSEYFQEPTVYTVIDGVVSDLPLDSTPTEDNANGNVYQVTAPSNVVALCISLYEKGEVEVHHDVIRSRHDLTEAAVSNLEERTDGIETEPLDKVNLFNPASLGYTTETVNVEVNGEQQTRYIYHPQGTSGVIDDFIVDASGNAVPFSPEGHSNYSGVAAFPVTTGKYYLIYNPYTPKRNLGVTHVSAITGDRFRTCVNNNQASNILFDGDHITIAKAIWSNPNVSEGYKIDALVFLLYFRPKTSQEPPTDFSNVEVWEFDTENDAFAYLYSRFGETRKLKGINLEQQMLDVGGTLGSVYGSESCLVLGDSISADHAWSDAVACKLRMREMYNVAIGGASIHAPYVRRKKNSDQNYIIDGNYDLIYQILNLPNKLWDVCEMTGQTANVINQQGTPVNGAKVKKIDNVVIFIGSNNTGEVSHNSPTASAPAGGWTVETLRAADLADWEVVKETDWESLLPDEWGWTNLDAKRLIDDSNPGKGYEYLGPAGAYTNFTTLYHAVKYCLMLLRRRVITAEVNGTTYGVDCTNARIVWVTPMQRHNPFNTSAEVYRNGEWVSEAKSFVEWPEPVAQFGGLTRMERIKRIEYIVKDVCDELSVPVVIGRTEAGISAMVERSYCDGPYQYRTSVGGTARTGYIFAGKNLRDDVHMTSDGYNRVVEMMVRALTSR